MQPLLLTKLFRPKPAPRAISRPDLEAKLALIAEVKLSLLTAPAGYGKTTAIAGWIDAQTGPVLWLTLDESDNDPVRFLRYLIAAFQKEDNRIGQDVLALIQAGQGSPFPQSFEALVTYLVNDVVNAFEDDLYLVLDDFHLIQDETITAGVQHWIEHVPPNCHTILMSRHTPQFPLSRWRVRRQLLEIGVDDLRFSKQEVHDLIAAASNVNLDDNGVSQLAIRTEGWAAGLQLAALFLRNRPDATALVSAFTGTNRFVADYLVEEVFAQLGEEVEQFLLEISILNRFSGSLCAAVSQHESSVAQLELLARDNFFVIPLDDEGYWFRFHGLVAEFLNDKLRQISEAHRQELHTRAYHWLVEHEWEEEALEHALAAGLYEEGRHLLQARASEMLWKSGEARTFVRWCQMLPPEEIFKSPELAINYAWSFFFQGVVGSLSRYLDELIRYEEIKLTPSQQSEIAILEAEVALHLGQIERVVEKLDLVNFDLLTEETSLAISRQIQGYVYRLIGRVPEAIEVLNEALEISIRKRLCSLESMAAFDLGVAYTLAGQLDQAAQMFDGLIATYGGMNQNIRIDLAYFGMADVYYQQNRLDEAALMAQRGLNANQINGWLSMLEVYGLRSLARIRQAQGEWGVAQDLLDETRQLQEKEVSGQPLDEIVRLDTYLHLLEGETKQPARFAAQYPAERPAHLTPLQYHRCGVIYGRYLLAIGKPESGISFLLPLLDDALAGQWLESALEINILLALACQHQEEPDKGLIYLTAALSIAEPGRYIQPFINEGEPMTRLLRLAQTQTKSVGNERFNRYNRFVGEIQARFMPMTPPESLTFVDPLTKREIEVIQLIAAGHSNPEIAERLIVATGTVAKHTNSIFGKLAVRNRTEAVAKAQQLGILK